MKQLKLVWDTLKSRKLVHGDYQSNDFAQFCEDMADLLPAELERGVEGSKVFTGFFTFPAFRELCREPVSDAEVRMAYKEACNAKNPVDQQKYKDPKVYWAAGMTGWFELRSLEEVMIYPKFKANYLELVKREQAGEVFEMPNKPMIEHNPDPVFDIELGKKRVSQVFADVFGEA